jgi:exosome complex RNA-binding protein Csl4
MNKSEAQTTFKYPEIGSNVKCLVLKTSFAQAELRIVEIEGFETPVNYRAVLKGNSVAEEIYISDKIQKNDLIDCVVISFGENSIVVSQI